LFLALNGFELVFSPSDAITAVESLAAGTIGEPELAAWFRTRSQTSAL